jgi:hypothetical protein
MTAAPSTSPGTSLLPEFEYTDDFPRLPLLFLGTCMANDVDGLNRIDRLER